MAFDPAAATAAYLAALPPETHARATEYTQGGHWLLLWGTLAGIAAAVIILKLGVLRRIRDGIGHRGLAAAAIAGAYAVLVTLLLLPWDIYAHWWRETQYGLTSQPLGGWLGEQAIGLGITVVATAAFFAVFYWIVRRSPRLWPVWAGLLTSAFLLFIMFVQPIFIEPLFNKYREAPAGPVRELVVQMGRQVGVPTDKIYVYDGSKQSNRYTANVSGLFGTSRIAMSDVMFAKGADIAEVRGVMGHEMGHYVHRHILIIVTAFGGLVALAGFLVRWLFPRVQSLLREDRIAGISDPAGLPIMMIIAAVLGLLATPVLNSIIRIQEADADNFSLAKFNEPDGLAKALVKTIEYRAATPSQLEEVIFYDHPSVGWRVRNAMDWKARHGGQPTAPSAGSAPAPAAPPAPRAGT